MKEIKYSYCLDENNELVHIGSVTEENRHSHTYHCLECGQPMIAKIGKIKVPHFAHGADTACEGESYLHKLAKRRIREKFMSADTFPLTFIRDVPCKEINHCQCSDKINCLEYHIRIPTDLKIWEGKVIYDICQEEVKVGDFRPDLLLTCSTKPDRPPVFIEIYKAHESEESKVTSEYRIVETMKIKSEADIDDIIGRGFIEGDNCKTFNFTPNHSSVKKNDVPIYRLALFQNGGATMLTIDCAKMHERHYPSSIAELNLKYNNLGISIPFDPYQTGLLYFRKKGMLFKNCIICKNYLESFYGDRICYYWKSLKILSKHPNQTRASICPRYEENPKLMNYPLEELEKMISEVP